MGSWVHPREAGFTPRYIWCGRHRCIIWRHCGVDARKVDKLVLCDDGMYHTAWSVTCPVCGLRAGGIEGLPRH